MDAEIRDITFGPSAAPAHVERAGTKQHSPLRLVAHEIDGVKRVEIAGYGSAPTDITAFCANPSCPDYHRTDFPSDRPHFHFGARVAAIAAIQVEDVVSNVKPKGKR